VSTQNPRPTDTYEPPAINRFRVEAAMLEMIENLRRQGLRQEEIALTLADAAEDFVIRLANVTAEDDSETDNTTQYRH
jgi:hypothetical protein